MWIFIKQSCWLFNYSRFVTISKAIKSKWVGNTIGEIYRVDHLITEIAPRWHSLWSGAGIISWNRLPRGLDYAKSIAPSLKYQL